MSQRYKSRKQADKYNGEKGGKDWQQEKQQQRRDDKRRKAA